MAGFPPLSGWDGLTASPHGAQLMVWSGASPWEVLQEARLQPPPVDPVALRTYARRLRNQYGPADPYRLAVVLSPYEVPQRRSDWGALFELIQAAPETGVARIREGWFWSGHPGPRKLAALFPGQGSQYPGMLGELAAVFPSARGVLERAQSAFSETITGRSDLPLLQSIYPPAAMNLDMAEGNLKRTSITQPALAAVNAAMLTVLRGFGVHPEGVAGHSFGEISALFAADSLGERDYVHLAEARGRLMAGSGASLGGMLAVFGSREDVEACLRDTGTTARIANHNAPQQCVVAGTEEALHQAEAALKARRLRARHIPVAAAFHTPLMAHAEAPLSDYLDEVALHAPRIPVYANVTCRPYPNIPSAMRRLLIEQLVHPVEWVTLVETMAQDGFTTFLEVGPSAVLSGLAAKTLEKWAQPHLVLPTDQGSTAHGDGLRGLAMVLAALWAQGFAPRLNLWDPA